MFQLKKYSVCICDYKCTLDAGVHAGNEAIILPRKRVQDLDRLFWAAALCGTTLSKKI